MEHILHYVSHAKEMAHVIQYSTMERINDSKSETEVIRSMTITEQGCEEYFQKCLMEFESRLYQQPATHFGAISVTQASI